MIRFVLSSCLYYGLLLLPVIHSLVYCLHPCHSAYVSFFMHHVTSPPCCGSLVLSGRHHHRAHAIHSQCEIFVWYDAWLNGSRSRSMCINPIISCRERTYRAKLIEARSEDRKRESLVSLILIHHQFKFKTVYSIRLSEFPRERIIFTDSRAILWLDWADY